jgi:hypothetical protein
MRKKTDSKSRQGRSTTPSMSTVKDKFDKVFSQFIRLRDSDENGFGECCTCSKRIHWKESHCGHFISRRHLGTRWDERNTSLQCPYCNVYCQGQQYFFSVSIEKRWGRGTVNELINLSKQTVKLTKAEYEEMIDLYKKKVKQLENKKNKY